MEGKPRPLAQEESASLSQTDRKMLPLARADHP
jgi:hypothetical protein